MIEYTYSIPYAPNSEFTEANGSVTTVLNQSNVTLNNGDWNGSLTVGSLIKLYDPLFPNNYVVDIINTVHSTSIIELNNDIANDNVVGSELKIDKIEFQQQGFKYISNNNVIRYYNEDSVLFTRYDTFQLKVVLLAENDKKVPKIDDLRGVAVTA